VLDRSVFGALGLGLLDLDAFRTGTAAKTAAHRIIYDPATGRLFNDADGNTPGGVAAAMVATLTAGTALTADDILVIAWQVAGIRRRRHSPCPACCSARAEQRRPTKATVTRQGRGPAGPPQVSHDASSPR
jgi:hypothetical protein